MSQSPMSITQLCNNDNDELHTTDINDPEVRLAAEALDDLANSKSNHSTKIPPILLPPISTMSAPSTTPSSPAVATPSGSIQSARQSFSSDTTEENDLRLLRPSNESQHFMRRVSNHPFVHSALRAYESSKASSPVVKYGAEMMESIASPIYDKFGRQHTDMTSFYPNDEDPTVAATNALANASLNDHQHQDTTTHRRTKHSRDDSLHLKKSSSRSTSRSTSPHRPYTLSAKSPNTIHHHHHRPATAASRSRWKQLVVHAGSAAGTTAAIISEESMKCLKYCLYWLQYATQHIEQQMHLLRNVLVSMATGSKTSSTAVSTGSHNSTLASIKKEVIETLRKVVEVITKYAGTGLPEQAKASVRSFILALPSRWALLNNNSSSSPAASPSLAPSSPSLQETSVKLLNFGSESVEMLQSVSTVFSDTVDRADLWLDRLHAVGVTRRSTTRQKSDDPMETTN
ncbi:transcription factor Opi1-domain-containing protein [Halteromyces radiatus]|uniref:transcription factor Opi1-domain-containing protein n=1 Tax=Halteromyces radiatus TaxID=101107 RepID=UPI002220CC51|nr:transcription factor Opi1-domain-containing protein [Halteromyces radiatus]KAI8093672.1 transcription factor Opi1-domain-containing protein [Halteromyces radiatus]